MTDQGRRFDADEARGVWELAARPQAEGAVRPRLAPGTEGDQADGYSLAEIRTAAVEAGIGGDFVDAAAAEMRAKALLPGSGLGTRGRALFRGFFGEVVDAITVRRVIRASPAEVLAAMEAVFPRDPYRMTLRDEMGDPVQGGVLVFDIPGFSLEDTQGFAGEVVWSGMRQIHTSVRAIPGEDPSCELVLSGPIAPSHRLGLIQGLIATGVAGVAGGGLATAVAAGLLAGPAGLVVGATAAGTLAGGAVGRGSFRALCGWGIRKAEWALEGLLAAVAAHATGRWRDASAGSSTARSIAPPTT